MLALCLMLSGTYYAKNYASIIGRGLFVTKLYCTSGNIDNNFNLAIRFIFSRQIKICRYLKFSISSVGGTYTLLMVAIDCQFTNSVFTFIHQI